MDLDRRELINRLCTEAGIALEEAGSSAVLIPGQPDETLRDAVLAVRDAVERARAIIAAAAALAAFH